MSSLSSLMAEAGLSFENALLGQQIQVVRLGSRQRERGSLTAFAEDSRSVCHQQPSGLYYGLIPLGSTGVGAAVVEVNVCRTVDVYHQCGQGNGVDRHIDDHAINAVLVVNHVRKLLCRKVQSSGSGCQIAFGGKIMCLYMFFFCAILCEFLSIFHFCHVQEVGFSCDSVSFR